MEQHIVNLAQSQNRVEKDVRREVVTTVTTLPYVHDQRRLVMLHELGSSFSRLHSITYKTYFKSR